MESRESRADSWKGPLLTLSCRHRPGWTGGSDRTKRGRTLEKRSGQRGSQSGERETRPTDTPQAVSRCLEHPLAPWSSIYSSGGNLGSLPTLRS